MFQPSKATKATRATTSTPRSFASSVPAKARQRTGDLDDQGWWRHTAHEPLLMIMVVVMMKSSFFLLIILLLLLLLIIIIMTCPTLAHGNLNMSRLQPQRPLHQPSPFGDTVTSWGAHGEPQAGLRAAVGGMFVAITCHNSIIMAIELPQLGTWGWNHCWGQFVMMRIMPIRAPARRMKRYGQTPNSVSKAMHMAYGPMHVTLDPEAPKLDERLKTFAKTGFTIAIPISTPNPSMWIWVSNWWAFSNAPLLDYPPVMYGMWGPKKNTFQKMRNL